MLSFWAHIGSPFKFIIIDQYLYQSRRVWLGDLGVRDSRAFVLDCDCMCASQQLFFFFFGWGTVLALCIFLIIYGSKACPWNNESAGDRDAVLEMHWMPQVYMMLNNAVQPDLAHIYCMSAMCWAQWGLWPCISHGLPFWSWDLWVVGLYTSHLDAGLML